jgi:hypothetical protein
MDFGTSLMHAVIIRRKDGTEFIASGGIKFGTRRARDLARELRSEPHVLRCRVARVSVCIKELKPAKKKGRRS